MGGTFSDLKITMDEFSRTQERMVRLLARHCGKSPAEVVKAIDRDRWMAPEEAVTFGIIDRVAYAGKLPVRQFEIATTVLREDASRDGTAENLHLQQG